MTIPIQKCVEEYVYMNLTLIQLACLTKNWKIVKAILELDPVKYKKLFPQQVKKSKNHPLYSIIEDDSKKNCLCLAIEDGQKEICLLIIAKVGQETLRSGSVIGKKTAKKFVDEMIKERKDTNATEHGLEYEELQEIQQSIQSKLSNKEKEETANEMFERRQNNTECNVEPMNEDDIKSLKENLEGERISMMIKKKPQVNDVRPDIVREFQNHEERRNFFRDIYANL